MLTSSNGYLRPGIGARQGMDMSPLSGFPELVRLRFHLKK